MKRRIKFAEDRYWWSVRCENNEFMICTRQAPFGRGVVYTIVDDVQGVRGPCNLIGQGWDEHMNDQACTELLDALMCGEVEVSHRNRLITNIVGEWRPPWERLAE